MRHRNRWAPPPAGARPPAVPHEIEEVHDTGPKAGEPLPAFVELTPAGPPLEIIELYPNPLPPPPPPFDRAAALAGLQAAFALLTDDELQVARLRMLGTRLVDIDETLDLAEDAETIWKRARRKLGIAIFGPA